MVVGVSRICCLAIWIIDAHTVSQVHAYIASWFLRQCVIFKLLVNVVILIFKYVDLTPCYAVCYNDFTNYFIHLALVKFQRDANGVPDVICSTLNVLGATYANCDGRYKVTGESVEWAPERPVYKHSEKDRFIFWNAHGLGWSIGKEEYLKSGSHWHRSKLDIV